MDAKLRIDLTQGILEVEGSEKFVNEIYRDFKENLSSKLKVEDIVKPPRHPKLTSPEKNDTTNQQSQKKRKASSKTKSPSLVKNLDLLGKGKEKSLKDFVSLYTPSSAMEWNLLFVYYLQKILEVPAIGVDEVYTCYKHLGEKPPTILNQSLKDTASRKGSIDTSSLDAITVTMTGENLVEHDMPRKE